MNDPSHQNDVQESWTVQDLPEPRKRNSGLLIGLVALILALATGLAWTLFVSMPGGGPPGPAGAMGAMGPPGAAGPPGTPGRPGASLRFAEFGCDQPACSLSCNEGERIVNVYTFSAAATYFYEDDRRVTVRPMRRPSSKIVLICVPE
jgi:hypothetical protein